MRHSKRNRGQVQGDLPLRAAGLAHTKSEPGFGRKAGLPEHQGGLRDQHHPQLRAHVHSEGRPGDPTQPALSEEQYLEQSLRVLQGDRQEKVRADEVFGQVIGKEPLPGNIGEEVRDRVQLRPDEEKFQGPLHVPEPELPGLQQHQPGHLLPGQLGRHRPKHARGRVPPARGQFADSKRNRPQAAAGRDLSRVLRPRNPPHFAQPAEVRRQLHAEGPFGKHLRESDGLCERLSGQEDKGDAGGGQERQEGEQEVQDGLSGVLADRPHAFYFAIYFARSELLHRPGLADR